jgi:hypothetical protein
VLSAELAGKVTENSDKKKAVESVWRNGNVRREGMEECGGQIETSDGGARSNCVVVLLYKKEHWQVVCLGTQSVAKGTLARDVIGNTISSRRNIGT